MVAIVVVCIPVAPGASTKPVVVDRGYIIFFGLPL